MKESSLSNLIQGNFKLDMPIDDSNDPATLIRIFSNFLGKFFFFPHSDPKEKENLDFVSLNPFSCLLV